MARRREPTAPSGPVGIGTAPPWLTHWVEADWTPGPMPAHHRQGTNDGVQQGHPVVVREWERNASGRLWTQAVQAWRVEHGWSREQLAQHQAAAGSRGFRRRLVLQPDQITHPDPKENDHG